MCETSRYFVAKPWFADTLSGGGMRCGMGSFAEGEVVGFSTTVPNCAKAVGVRSSIGIRMDGAGIEDGILLQHHRMMFAAGVVGSSMSRLGKWSSDAKIAIASVSHARRSGRIRVDDECQFRCFVLRQTIANSLASLHFRAQIPA
jgi:hypothetical protein